MPTKLIFRIIILTGLLIMILSVIVLDQVLLGAVLASCLFLALPILGYLATQKGELDIKYLKKKGWIAMFIFQLLNLLLCIYIFMKHGQN